MAYLTSFFSSMGGGKTTLLLQVCYNYEQNNQKVILIKPEIDTKANDKVLSRLKLERKVDILLKANESLLENYFETIKDSDVIVVDEGQFLKKNQVLELWAITKEWNIPVITYGLKTNFKGELFLGTQELIAKADHISDLPLMPICRCGKKGCYNARKVNGSFTFEGEEVVIDGALDNVEYVSLCGECYYAEMRKQNIGIASTIAKKKMRTRKINE
ncbi:MAG: thymidine kinase [Bacilli bacterium]|jgi:thymidine kinase|nr:thymidine kinase [Bacilli bacterium]